MMLTMAAQGLARLTGGEVRGGGEARACGGDGFGGAPAKRRRASGARGGDDADGGDAEAEASLEVALEVAGLLGGRRRKTSIPASRGGEGRGEWGFRGEEWKGHTVLLFIGAEEHGRGRSGARCHGGDGGVPVISGARKGATGRRRRGVMRGSQCVRPCEGGGRESRRG